jgi:hypothetical protein
MVYAIFENPINEAMHQIEVSCILIFLFYRSDEKGAGMSHQKLNPIVKQFEI